MLPLAILDPCSLRVDLPRQGLEGESIHVIQWKGIDSLSDYVLTL